MNPGDLVQIRQHLYLPENTVAKPPVHSGPSEAWIYAEVLEVIPSPSDVQAVRVKVNHPGNHEHREEMTVPVGDVRTVADVDNLAAKATTPELKKHFQVQADRLRKANAKPASSRAPLTGAAGKAAQK